MLCNLLFLFRYSSIRSSFCMAPLLWANERKVRGKEDGCYSSSSTVTFNFLGRDEARERKYVVVRGNFLRLGQHTHRFFYSQQLSLSRLVWVNTGVEQLSMLFLKTECRLKQASHILVITNNLVSHFSQTFFLCDVKTTESRMDRHQNHVWWGFASQCLS